MSEQITTTVTEETRLPSFMRQREGRLELVLHCTGIQTYYICPCKYWLSVGEELEAALPRPALNYGAAVHEALAVRYREVGRAVEEIEARQMDAIQRCFDENPQPDDEWRNCGRAQDLIRAYNEQYATEEFQVLGVEEEFEALVGVVPCHSPINAADLANRQENVPCYLAGRKDLIVAWNDGLWVVDHKTASDWGSGDSNSHLDEGRRSFQFRGYAWAEREAQRQAQLTSSTGFSAAECPRVFTPVLGTIGNYLISRKPYATDRKVPTGKAALPRNQFHREAYPFEGEQLDEWREQFLRTAKQILAQWQDGSIKEDRHDTGCGHWGRCEFYDYCQESPSRRDAMLAGSMFRPRVKIEEL